MNEVRPDREANRIFSAWRIHRWNSANLQRDSFLRFASSAKAPRHARIFCYLQMVGKQYRLDGGEREIRTPETFRHTAAKFCGSNGPVFDFTSGTITIRDPKSGEDEHILMNSTAQQTLKSLWDSSTRVLQLKAGGPDKGSFVFTAPRGGFIQNLKRYWYPALRRTGIDDFQFHDLRHTFASRAAMSGVDLYTLQALMRHRSSLMTQRYVHPSAAHQREAIRRSDGWHERQNT